MHSYKHYIFYFFLIITVYGTAKSEAIIPTTADQAPSLSLELEMAQTMCLNQNERLRDDLLAIIDYTDEHLTYWQETQHNPYSYFFSKGPLKLLWGKGQSEEIEDHITKLQRSQSWACYHLGEVYRLSNGLKLAESDEKLKPLLYQAINSVKDYLNNTKTKVSPEQTITIEELTNLLQKNIKKLTYTKKGLMAALNEHQKPGHITRNWVAYTGIAVLTAFTAKYFYDNPGKPSEWYTNGCNAIKKFFIDHIKEPADEISKTMLSKSNENNIQFMESITSQKEIERTQHNVKSLILAQWPHLSEDEVEKIIRGEDPRLDTVWDSSIDYPWKVTDWSLRAFPNIQNLIKMGNITFKSYRYRLLKEINEVKELGAKALNASRLNFALFMTTPAALLLYGTYKTAKNIAYWFVPKYTFHIPVKNYLRLIGQLLNRFNSPHVIMGPEQDGYLLYWSHKLKGYVSYMPYSIRKNFMEDIEELELPDLQIHQKLEIWNRMYKTYEFLMPHQANLGYPLV